VKTSLLPILVCPSCRGSLALRADRREAEEVLDGELSCRCGRGFPVRAGVPIFVPESYVRSFSFQWHIQKTDSSNEALSAGVKRRFLRAVDRDAGQFSGRRVLDAGCGRGVLLRLLVDHGAECIGIDMSDGIEIAASRVQGTALGHAVRCDILEPPFPDGSFDAIFSLGVLHHTRDCRGAVLRLARLLRPGGELIIWVYSAYGRYRNACSDFLRRLTTRMPPRLLYLLCHLAVPLQTLQEIPVLGLPFRLIPIAGEGPWRWVVLGTFDWYSPRFQSKHTFPEVFRWFEEAGLEGIRVHDWGIAVSGRAPLQVSGPVAAAATTGPPKA